MQRSISPGPALPAPAQLPGAVAAASSSRRQLSSHGSKASHTTAQPAAVAMAAAPPPPLLTKMDVLAKLQQVNQASLRSKQPQQLAPRRPSATASLPGSSTSGSTASSVPVASTAPRPAMSAYHMLLQKGHAARHSGARSQAGHSSVAPQPAPAPDATATAAAADAPPPIALPLPTATQTTGPVTAGRISQVAAAAAHLPARSPDRLLATGRILSLAACKLSPEAVGRILTAVETKKEQRQQAAANPADAAVQQPVLSTSHQPQPSLAACGGFAQTPNANANANAGVRSLEPEDTPNTGKVMGREALLGGMPAFAMASWEQHCSAPGSGRLPTDGNPSVRSSSNSNGKDQAVSAAQAAGPAAAGSAALAAAHSSVGSTNPGSQTGDGSAGAAESHVHRGTEAEECVEMEAAAFEFACCSQAAGAQPSSGSSPAGPAANSGSASPPPSSAPPTAADSGTSTHPHGAAPASTAATEPLPASTGAALLPTLPKSPVMASSCSVGVWVRSQTVSPYKTPKAHTTPARAPRLAHAIAVAAAAGEAVPTAVDAGAVDGWARAPPCSPSALHSTPARRSGRVAKRVGRPQGPSPSPVATSRVAYPAASTAHPAATATSDRNLGVATTRALQARSVSAPHTRPPPQGAAHKAPRPTDLKPRAGVKHRTPKRPRVMRRTPRKPAAATSAAVISSPWMAHELSDVSNGQWRSVSLGRGSSHRRCSTPRLKKPAGSQTVTAAQPPLAHRGTLPDLAIDPSRCIVFNNDTASPSLLMHLEHAQLVPSAGPCAGVSSKNDQLLWHGNTEFAQGAASPSTPLCQLARPACPLSQPQLQHCGLRRSEPGLHPGATTQPQQPPMHEGSARRATNPSPPHPDPDPDQHESPGSRIRAFAAAAAALMATGTSSHLTDQAGHQIPTAPPLLPDISLHPAQTTASLSLDPDSTPLAAASPVTSSKLPVMPDISAVVRQSQPGHPAATDPRVHKALSFNLSSSWLLNNSSSKSRALEPRPSPTQHLAWQPAAAHSRPRSPMLSPRTHSQRPSPCRPSPHLSHRPTTPASSAGRGPAAVHPVLALRLSRSRSHCGAAAPQLQEASPLQMKPAHSWAELSPIIKKPSSFNYGVGHVHGVMSTSGSIKKPGQVNFAGLSSGEIIHRALRRGHSAIQRSSHVKAHSATLGLPAHLAGFKGPDGAASYAAAAAACTSATPLSPPRYATATAASVAKVSASANLAVILAKPSHPRSPMRSPRMVSPRLNTSRTPGAARQPDTPQQETPQQEHSIAQSPYSAPLAQVPHGATCGADIEQSARPLPSGLEGEAAAAAEAGVAASDLESPETEVVVVASLYGSSLEGGGVPHSCLPEVDRLAMPGLDEDDLVVLHMKHADEQQLAQQAPEVAGLASSLSISMPTASQPPLVALDGALSRSKQALGTASAGGDGGCCPGPLPMAAPGALPSVDVVPLSPRAPVMHPFAFVGFGSMPAAFRTPDSPSRPPAAAPSLDLPAATSAGVSVGGQDNKAAAVRLLAAVAAIKAVGSGSSSPLNQSFNLGLHPGSPSANLLHRAAFTDNGALLAAAAARLLSSGRLQGSSAGAAPQPPGHSLAQPGMTVSLGLAGHSSAAAVTADLAEDRVGELLAAAYSAGGVRAVRLAAAVATPLGTAAGSVAASEGQSSVAEPAAGVLGLDETQQQLELPSEAGSCLAGVRLKGSNEVSECSHQAQAGSTVTQPLMMAPQGADPQLATTGPATGGQTQQGQKPSSRWSFSKMFAGLCGKQAR
ncbi:hypothetical protein QJQ45_006947 [Haematococcus lacustris]|nr:hypothetical protein QJQ45_006947 [Haematococcus lacustris]